VSLFDKVPILPQQAARTGMRGADGAAGAAGAPGPAGAAGAEGSFTLVTRDFTNAELQTINTPTAFPLTAAQAGFLQVVVAGGFEINKTHLSGAGAVPSWLVRYIGTAVNAMNLGVMDLGNTRNFGNNVEQPNVLFDSGGVGVVPPGAGLGLETIWSATYAPSTFSGTARLWLIVASVPLRF